MKTFVAYYINQDKIAGMDGDSGGYAYPTDNVEEFKFWNNERKLLEYINIMNYGKSSSTKEFLAPRLFNWKLIEEKNS